jgi:hypothetical protein
MPQVYRRFEVTGLVFVILGVCIHDPRGDFDIAEYVTNAACRKAT